MPCPYCLSAYCANADAEGFADGIVAVSSGSDISRDRTVDHDVEVEAAVGISALVGRDLVAGVIDESSGRAGSPSRSASARTVYGPSGTAERRIAAVRESGQG
jgi:hypothetical protein